MVDKFVTAHVGAKKAEARGWRSRQNGLSRDGSRGTRKLLSQLMKYPPITWDEIHNAYYAEVRANEDNLNGQTHQLISVQTESRKERRDNFRRDHPVSRHNRERHQPHVRAAAAPSPRYKEGPSRPKTRTRRNERGMPPLLSAHNFCVSPTEIIYAPEKLGTKVRNNFARGRKKQGLPKPTSPARTINMIIGGDDDASIKGVKLTTTHKLKRSITNERYDRLEESIIFHELDAGSLTFPQNDAPVITLCILDTDVKRVMVDDGSGAFIIHPLILTQMRLKDKIVSRCIMLTGFKNAVERASGEITLPVLAGGVTLEMTFHIID
nr:uncharacterized protein LOC104105229 [Nicotiana tomentosiformis]